MLTELLSATKVGLDIETTGRDPRVDRIRLVQFAVPDHVYVVDLFQVHVQALRPLFESGLRFIGHNLKFDLQFLTAAGLPVPAGDRLFDTMLAHQLLEAGTQFGYLNHSGLDEVAERHLGVVLDKSLQKSNWAGVLTAEQHEYAASDAAVLLPLAEKLDRLIQADGLSYAMDLEMRALPAIVWLESSGVPFDWESWALVSDTALRSQYELEAELQRLLEERFPDTSTVNWCSPAQVTRLLRQLGYRVDHVDEAALVPLAASDQLVATLLKHREASRASSGYGIKMIDNVHGLTRRIHASFIQMGASSGRMSCSSPNLQNIPRDKKYRRCFRPGPGRVFVKADYSQIELRIAAEYAKDQRMIEAYQRGDDLHVLTAQAVLGGANSSDVTEQMRQAAKALNFGLLYGMGAPRLQEYASRTYGVDFSLSDAYRFRERFFDTYPGIRRWHASELNGLSATRTLAGRRRLNLHRFSERLNSPVQGTGADGLKAALAWLWEHRDLVPSAVPVLVVHDEIVIECDAGDAARAQSWLRQGMVEGMQLFLKTVPVEVGLRVLDDWGGPPE
jgi:DNA polymerase-1